MTIVSICRHDILSELENRRVSAMNGCLTSNLYKEISGLDLFYMDWNNQAVCETVS